MPSFMSLSEYAASELEKLARSNARSAERAPQARRANRQKGKRGAQPKGDAGFSRDATEGMRQDPDAAAPSTTDTNRRVRLVDEFITWFHIQMTLKDLRLFSMQIGFT
jgi:hypothetical protein